MTKNKYGLKTMAMLIALIMLSAFIPVITVNAAYENTHVNTGNQAEDIAAVAETQVGYKEGANNSNVKYNYWFGKLVLKEGTAPTYNYAWCQTFVAWCANQANIETSKIAKVSGTVSGIESFKKNNTWHSGPGAGGAYTPKRGDIIYFCSSSSDSGYHVGIVTGCDGSTVYTVEGNSSDMVAKRSYAVTNSKIYGYGVFDGENIIIPDKKDIFFHNDDVSDLTISDATISVWTSNDSGEHILESGFYFGNDENNMKKYVAHTDIEWTDYYDSYKLSEYCGSLSPGKTYSYKWYATTSEKTFESEIYQLTTYGTSNVNYNYMEESEISCDNAKLSIWTYNENGYEISSFGIMIGTDIKALEKVEVNNNISWTDFYKEIDIKEYYSSLIPETQYYYRWYSEIDTKYYSEIHTFTTTRDIYPPLIQGVFTEDMTYDSFTLGAKISDNHQITKVTFDVWKDGSPFIKTYEANHSYDDYYCYRINTKDLTGEPGVYHAIVHAFDTSNESTSEYTIIVPKRVLGDANNDGEVTVTDAVMLQKWLLGSSKELTCWQNVDLCEDGVIDVFDMVMLRRLLVEKKITK